MNFEVLPKQPPHQSANTSGSSKKQRHAPATPDDEDIGGVMSDGAQMSGGALASGGLPFVFSIVGGGSPALSPSHVSSASSASQLRSSAKKRVVATAAASASQPRPSPNLRSPYNTSQRTASPAVFTSSQHHHQLHQYHPAAAPIEWRDRSDISPSSVRHTGFTLGGGGGGSDLDPMVTKLKFDATADDDIVALDFDDDQLITAHLSTGPPQPTLSPSSVTRTAVRSDRPPIDDVNDDDLEALFDDTIDRGIDRPTTPPPMQPSTPQFSFSVPKLPVSITRSPARSSTASHAGGAGDRDNSPTFKRTKPASRGPLSEQYRRVQSQEHFAHATAKPATDRTYDIVAIKIEGTIVYVEGKCVSTGATDLLCFPSLKPSALDQLAPGLRVVAHQPVHQVVLPLQQRPVVICCNVVLVASPYSSSSSSATPATHPATASRFVPILPSWIKIPAQSVPELKTPLISSTTVVIDPEQARLQALIKVGADSGTTLADSILQRAQTKTCAD